LLTGLWVVIIWLSVYLVDRWFIHLDLIKRFLIYLGLIGLIVLFLLLAYLTILNVTNETLAKWGELDGVLAHVGMHVNPEIADSFGWKILLLGAIITVIGHVLGRSSAKR